jgi:succinyl-CoA synthetase alpha subunit/citrate synthase
MPRKLTTGGPTPEKVNLSRKLTGRGSKMIGKASKPFDYFVGIYSLEELVTKESRVCVINILGAESRKVTPVSHEYSGGNIVAGVQYGRTGSLETKSGEIPVFPSIRDVMLNGVEFDIGVIYLPPVAVSQAVSELINFNRNLKRIVIVTEKIPAKDSMYIRILCQEAGVDVIGANCLGVANVWDNVRVGGALGGDNPGETLKKGTVAIHSNSGNFTTTIAEYMRTGGFGISTAVSSGKDVYIHFALPEFLFAAQNDPRTKAVALYVEPGGYYEKIALDMIRDRKFGFNKPIVVCVTGRWKKDINRSCGHAGALAGSGDDALGKEKWFDDYFQAPCFDPENPEVSKKGVRIASIQDFPKAISEVYKKIDEKPDFQPSGDLSLKLWLSDSFIKLPEKLHLDSVEAIEPYNKRIREINKQIGAQYLRQNMRNKSGASKMNKETLVAEQHGRPILDLAKYTLEENLYFSLAKRMPDNEDIPSINLLLNLLLRIDQRLDMIMDIAGENGCTPNSMMASAISLIGENPVLKKAEKFSRDIITLIREYGIDSHTNDYPAELINSIGEKFPSGTGSEYDEISLLLINEIKNSGKDCEPLRFSKNVIEMAEKSGKIIQDSYSFLLASIATCIFWKPMLEKRITRETAETSLYYFTCVSTIAALSVMKKDKNQFRQNLTRGKLSGLTSSFTDNIFAVLFNRKGNESEITEFKYIAGLTLTNGPGTISAKGAKESVSARNHIATAFTGFLVNTGLAHGGNGFEAVEYLLENFESSNLKNPGNEKHGLDLDSLANTAAKQYRDYVKEQKEAGKTDYKRIPCINHPVFKGAAVNIDPREEFVKKELEAKNIYNVFIEFYHKLVKELYREGVTKNVFCVNVDAVISVIALKLVWNDLSSGKMEKEEVQKLVFLLFLIGRAIGVSAEISDHRDRGLDMDCRTPQPELNHVL